MPVADVLRLQEYRDRRSSRVRIAQVLHSGDPRRAAVFGHLVEIAELTGADRAAAVWVDEHGPGLVHPHVVADQLSARPRRVFASCPLGEAWHLGIPAAHDRLAEPSAAIPATFAVALGSDGTRAWFVVADSIVARPAIGADVRDQVMFRAGEIAAVVLNRDLDARSDDEVDSLSSARFAGWDVLADLEGRESLEGESRRIAQRFVVARLVRMFLDDDLTASHARTSGQVRRARAELTIGLEPGPEPELWERTLSALEEDRLDDLAQVLVELGDVAEAQGHVHGALEIYRCAYDVAVAIGSARSAVDAARLAGRLTRRRAQWEEADRWLRLAYDVAKAAGLEGAMAQAMVGLAGITKEIGKLRVAREEFQAALVVAERSREPEVVALVHHALLGLEQQAGEYQAALHHGWAALNTYESDVSRTRCMAGLAGVLTDCGDLDAAEDAWTVVAHKSDEKYYLTYAHSSLAHIAALKGDQAAFERHASRCDALDWETGSASAKAEVLCYRGISYRALGELEHARAWLKRAVEFCEERGYNRVLFLAENTLKQLDETPAVEAPAPAAPALLRDGLRAMRRELVGAGA